MALAQQTIGGNGNSPGSVTTLDITGFTVTGSNKVLYVCYSSNTTTDSTPSVVWDSAGANEPFPAPIAEETAGDIIFKLWRLIAPTDGTSKTISLSGLPSGGTECAIAVLFTGVDQTTPNDTVNPKVGNAAGLNSDLITSPAGDWIVSFCRVQADVSASITQQGGAAILTQPTGNNNAIISYDNDQDGVDDTMDWAWTGTNDCGLFTFNLNAASAAAGDMGRWGRTMRLIALRNQYNPS